MILAGVLDTYDILAGSPIYNRAIEVANEALFSRYVKGWNPRKEQLLKITHALTQPLRKVKPDFFEALYLYDEGKYKEAYKFSLNTLEGIKEVFKYDPNNKYLSLFFNAHHKKIAMLFEGQIEHLKTLTILDSKHRESYREYMPNN